MGSKLCSRLSSSVGLSPPPPPAPPKQSVHLGTSCPSPGPVVSGVPKPEVTWFLDGAPVKRREGTFEVYEAGGSHYLCLPRARARDSGNYSCTATNIRGQVSCTWTLLVKSEYTPPGHPRLSVGGPPWGASYTAQVSSAAASHPPTPTQGAPCDRSITPTCSSRPKSSL